LAIQNTVEFRYVRKNQYGNTLQIETDLHVSFEESIQGFTPVDRAQRKSAGVEASFSYTIMN